MDKKEREKQQRLRQAQYEREKAQIDNCRQKAPKLKPILRQVGCDLPFFDYLDSYSEEFARTAASALKKFSSLLGIHEVEDKDFQESDWAMFGADTYQQVFFDIDDEFSRYGTSSSPETNMRGSASYFLDSNGNVRSVVLIPRNPRCSFQHKELRYAFKIGSLLHELGHIQDAEQRINIDPVARRFDLVEAEAYANCYALEQLAARCLVQTYSMLYEAIQTLASSSGYEADIGRLVLEQHEHRQIPNWQDYMDAATKKAAAR